MRHSQGQEIIFFLNPVALHMLIVISVYIIEQLSKLSESTETKLTSTRNMAVFGVIAMLMVVSCLVPSLAVDRE